jgi:hypothetical protein
MNVQNNKEEVITTVHFNQLSTTLEFNKLSPYCDTTYNLLKTKIKTNKIVPYNKDLDINEYC